MATPDPVPADFRFARALVVWQRRHGRRDLPWQDTRDPYLVWLSEIMLQQTQVATVIPYYTRFLERFPDLPALARAREAEVLRLWSGLGYYARARNLHRAARELVRGHAGRFPRAPADIVRLPGIGRSTAAAIAVFAFGARAAILDGNVKRVLARAFGLEGDPATRAVETRMWTLAERLLPRRGIRAYTQGLMDLGATLCTSARPACDRCPLVPECVAHREARTAELPTPRARARKPTRRATWLVLNERGRVLLERRDAPGLWGGLWSFPEADDAREFCLRELGRAPRELRRLAPIEHAFTHFRLVATPLLASLGPGRGRARAPSGTGARRWFALGRAATQALPAPVRRLIEQLARAA